MPIAVNNKEIVAINCEGREIVRAHAGLSLVFSKQQPLYGGMDISSIADLVMFRDLINTGTCIWNGVSTNTYKGNPIATGGLGATWYVTTDIDMSAVCSPSLGSWGPIGNTSRQFAGTIQGLGHYISNLYISNTTTNQALFGYCTGAAFYDLNVLNVNVSAGNYAAGFIANMTSNSGRLNMIIKNCSVSGNVTGTAYIGGFVSNLVAITTNTICEIENCTNYCNITTTSNNQIGGIVGYYQIKTICASLYFRNNYNYGTVSATNGYAGGLIGYYNGAVSTVPSGYYTISNCINYGNLIANGSIKGGIMGYSLISGSVARLTFDLCVNEGAVHGAISGGLFGSGYRIDFIDCTNNGDITTNGNYCGGFVASGGSFIFTDCVNNGNVTASGYSSQLYCGGFTTQLYDSGDHIFTRCKNYGTISATTGTPYLGGFFGDLGTSNATPVFIDCENHGDVICTLSAGASGGFWALSNHIYAKKATFKNCYNYGKIQGYQSMGFCNLVGLDSWFEDCTNYGEIAGAYSAFGITMGSNANNIRIERCITDCTLSATSFKYGLAGYLNNTCNIIDCEVKATTTVNTGGTYYGISSGPANLLRCIHRANVSGAAVYGFGEQIYSATDCYNYGNLSGTQRAAGMGYSIITTATGCYNYGNITSVQVTGGLFSYISSASATVTNCHNYGTINGNPADNYNNPTGGIVGIIQNGTVTNCTNNGAVSGGAKVGGIAGTISSSANNGYITNCVNNSAIYSGYNYAGGICGYIESGGTILDSVNNGAVFGTYHAGGITTQLNQNASYITNIQRNRNNGTITATMYVGGIVTTASKNANITLVDNESKANVIATTTATSNIYCGALIGYYAVGIVISNNRYDNTVETVYRACGHSNGAAGSFDLAGEAYGTTLP